MLAEGSYHDLQKSNLDFTKLLRSPTEKTVAPKPEPATNNPIKTNSLNRHNVFNRQLSNNSVASSVENSEFQDIQVEQPETVETQTFGSVSFDVYFTYFFAGGNRFKVIFLFFIFILAQVLSTGGDLWMTYW